MLCNCCRSRKVEFITFKRSFLKNPFIPIVEPVELEKEQATVSYVKRLREAFPEAVTSSQAKELTQITEHEAEDYLPSEDSIEDAYKQLTSSIARHSNRNSSLMIAEEGDVFDDNELQRAIRDRPAQWGVDVPTDQLVSSRLDQHAAVLDFFSRENFESPTEDDMVIVQSPEEDPAPFWVCQVVGAVDDSGDNFLVQWYDNDNSNIYGIYTARKQETQKKQKSGSRKKPVSSYVQELEVETFICWGFQLKGRKIPINIIRYALSYVSDS